MRTVFDVMAENIVNPRCDDCGASVEPRGRMGPWQCDTCQAKGEIDFQLRFAEFVRAEGPRRKYVNIPLPEGMRAVPPHPRDAEGAES